MNKFDFIVIGSGPAGQRAAIQAAKLGKSVAMIEMHTAVGGNCLHTGTIPSKTLRETVLYLTGWRQRGFYGKSYRVKERITAQDLVQRLDITTRHEIDVIQHQLYRNGVTSIVGKAKFLDPHSVRVTDQEGKHQDYEAKKFMISVGTSPVQPPNIPFDGKRILDSDHILEIEKLPRTMIVVGAGVIGVEYASIYSALDIDVTLVDGREDMLGFLDREIIDEFTHHLRDRGVAIRMGENVEKVEYLGKQRVKLHLSSGSQLRADMVLFAAGRQGNTDDLGLEKAGVSADERGLIEVNEHYRTKVKHIYAAGDVIGFPSLASTSMEQGRHATCHAFGKKIDALFSDFPFGIYAVPEMSVIGLTEKDCKEKGIGYEVGEARFRETSRGQILGLREGLLKLLFSLEDRSLIGVHIVGEGATELIHIGQAVMQLGGTMDYFVHNVFNYPTLAEAYKIAALHAWNRFPD